MFRLKTFNVYIPVSFFLSIVTFLINSRERQHNYQKKWHALIPIFWTIRYGQTVQTHIRLSIEKSNQGLHCLQFCQYLSLALFDSKPFWFMFLHDFNSVKGVIKLWNITEDIYQNFGLNAKLINLKPALTYIQYS